MSISSSISSSQFISDYNHFYNYILWLFTRVEQARALENSAVRIARTDCGIVYATLATFGAEYIDQTLAEFRTRHEFWTWLWQQSSKLYYQLVSACAMYE